MNQSQSNLKFGNRSSFQVPGDTAECTLGVRKMLWCHLLVNQDIAGICCSLISNFFFSFQLSTSAFQNNQKKIVVILGGKITSAQLHNNVCEFVQGTT